MAEVIAFRAPDRLCARLHVLRGGEGWELHHENRTGESWALLDRFDTREDAARGALDALSIFPGAKLGEVQA